MESIVALSTPVGRGAISVVRLSGDDCIDIAKKMFSPFPNMAGTLKVGNLKCKNFTDQAMCVFFSAPKSYTGENMVEFQCHGGNAIFRAVIDQCIDYGCRLAYNGEFSKRAFINGKQNLSNAEGIIEMIDAENTLALKAGQNLLQNKLGNATVEMQKTLLDIIAQTEVALDYPEEDLDLITIDQIESKLECVKKQLTDLLDTVKIGSIINSGISIAIVGESNVGKSSLLNAFLGTDRAIVTDIAGTTRDTLNEKCSYKDINFVFTDTAGIRETSDVVEKIGIERSIKAIEQADVILQVIDKDEYNQIITDKPIIVVRNKCDLIQNQTLPNLIYVSAKNSTNITLLKEKIYQMFIIGDISQDTLILTNARHIECLNRAKNSIIRALQSVKTTTLDCIEVDVKQAWNDLGEITGSTATEEVIDRIYEKFCLGK